MTPEAGAPLTLDEEITLRRVAHGQSDGSRLPANDMARLRALALVEGSTHTPRLTREGRQHFEGLARPMALTSFNAEDTLTTLVKRLGARRADAATAAGKRRQNG